MDDSLKNEQIENLLHSIAKEKGLKQVSDLYSCLLTVGDNWNNYPFKWSSIRDLAGLVRWPSSAPFIILISVDKSGEGIHVYEENIPISHIRITISPDTPVSHIIDNWISHLASHAPPFKERNDWFLNSLGLGLRDLSSKTREFLGYELQPMEISASLREIRSGSEYFKVSAIEIAKKLQQGHSDYAGNKFGGISFEEPKELSKYVWDDWQASIADLYDSERLAISKHEVLDGRLFLVGLGLLDEQLHGQLERNNAWSALLLEIDENIIESTGPIRDALNSIQLAHGFESDAPNGKDQLGIQGEVNALCEVIMDSKVEPPLAVGLFGAWGSGKSFFMEKMMERIDKSVNKSNIIQIRFNAWHYEDTSLWASLAVEIFERLADPEPVLAADRENWLKTKGDTSREKRKALLSNLETIRETKLELEAELEQYQQKKNDLIESRETLRGEREEAINNLSFRDIALELAKDQDFQEDMEEISNVLGVKPAIDQIGIIAAELTTSSRQIAFIWRNIKNPRFTSALLILALVLIALTLPLSLISEESSLYGLFSGIGSMAPAFIAFSNQIIPSARKVNSVLSRISSSIEKVKNAEAKVNEYNYKEERKLEEILHKTETEIDGITNGLTSINEKIASIEAQTESLTIGRRLYDFLADRAAGYQKHQGIIGMLHRDFRLLDAQVRSFQDSENDSGLPSINRVILYIDDLDRCAPSKVLEVLQAVHLLLALPLFVVVVGVDPRWMERSLRHQYKDLCLHGSPHKDPYLHSMPTEYLEKIFQIPLTLPAMENEAYGKLISSLAPGTTGQSVLKQSKPTESSARQATSDTIHEKRTPTRSLIQVQKGSAAEGVGGASIDLTNEEVEFIQKLGGLVDTPRAAKRLMNTYRLIRATQHVGSRSRFLGTDGKPGEYYAVLILLAVSAGFPKLSDRFLIALEEGAVIKNYRSWKKFVESLDTPDGELVPHDFRSPDPENLIVQSEMREWEEMVIALLQGLNSNQLNKLDPYQRWGRTVARFSFTL